VFDNALGIAYSAALVWLVGGTLFRLSVWLRAPSDFSIPLAPAPATRTGVFLRLLAEMFAFRSLWRGSRTGWLASVAFHYGLLFVLLMHLRFVFDQPPDWLITIIGISGIASGGMLAGLLVLLIRRCVVDRIRYISSPSDYLHLILILAILISGLLLKRIWPVSLYQVGEFVQGVVSLNWQPLPEHAGLIGHLLLVLLLILVFPISKLVHGIAIAVSPTFVQRDEGRKKN
jgi:nitrate reductase gamma subunit